MDEGETRDETQHSPPSIPNLHPPTPWDTEPGWQTRPLPSTTGTKELQVGWGGSRAQPGQGQGQSFNIFTGLWVCCGTRQRQEHPPPAAGAAGLTQRLLILRCPWAPGCSFFFVQGSVYLSICRAGEAAGVREGVLALPEPHSLSSAHGLILSRLSELGNSLKRRSAALQNWKSQQTLTAEGRETAGVWIASFCPQNELKQVHKLQNKTLTTAGNYCRDLVSPQQRGEPC